MLISIIVPVFNAEKTIKRCISSVLNQTYNNWELILIDDGSKDASLDICKSYEDQDSRITVFSQENKGVSSARNYGLRKAKGDYIFFLDGDDAIKIDALEQYVNIIIQESPDVIVGSLLQITNDGNMAKKGPQQEGCFGGDIWKYIARNSEPFGWAGGKAIRRELVCQNQINFRENMKSQEDLDFNLRIYEAADKIYTLKYAGYEYYYEPSSRTPNIPDFLRNQLFLERVASTKIRLDEEANRCVKERISILIYSYLYDALDYKTLCYRINEIRKVEGFVQYISRNSLHGMRGKIIKWVVNKNNYRIAAYMKLRKTVRFFINKLR